MASRAVARLGAAAIAVALLSPPASADAPMPAELASASEVELAPRAIEPPAQAPQAPQAPRSPRSPRSIDELLDERVQAGRHWRLDTERGAVHVWTPEGYDAATAATVVFVHGYWIDVDEAWQSYRLAQQFALSGLDAMFIVPEAPAGKRRQIPWPSLADLVRTVGGRVGVAMPAQRLIAVGHSGAYRTLALWLATPALDTVVLLDALYVDSGLLPWLRKSSRRRLVNIVYETGRVSDYLHRWLPDTRRVDGLPLDGLPDARILYVRTDVGHWQLVTEGVALPLALRAIAVPTVPTAPLDLPLGLPERPEPPPTIDWFSRSPLAPSYIDRAP